MLKDQNKSQHKAGVNEFLESLTFWDWLPMIISIASLIASIAAYCKH